MGVFDKTPEQIARRAAERHTPRNSMDVAKGPSPMALRGRGQTTESPQQMAHRAALLAAQEELSDAGHPSQRRVAPSALVALQAKQAQAQEAYTYGLGGADLKTQNEATRVRLNNNGSVLANGWNAENAGAHVMSTQAAVMAGNKSLSGSMTPRGYGGPDRPDDPRLSRQGRAQFDRIGAERAQQHYGHLNAAMAKATGEAQQLREQSRIQTEGDAWLLEQRRKQQAMTQPAAPTPALTQLARR